MLLFVFLLSFSVQKHLVKASEDATNDEILHDDRPIIGILSQKITEEFTPYVTHDSTYIAASYVKWIEGAGAQVIPILSTYSKKKVLKLVRSINGVLFPGGAAPLNDSNYARAARWIFNEAIRINDFEKRPFPLWGTCLGFEVLNVLGSGLSPNEILSEYDSENLLLEIDFTKEAFDSRLFHTIDMGLMRKMMFKKLSLHMHQAGINPDVYEKNSRIRKMFKVLASNLDKKGKEFVSVIEGRKYPFYGTQFHPEKNIYEWTRNEKINHSPDAILAAQYFANFFVNEARKSYIENMPVRRLKHLEDHLMFRYSPVYSGGSSLFEQVYTFKNQTINNRIKAKGNAL
ncbi:gamma-glutamyl hydrolase A-like [Clytia hemisphaerica]